MTVSEARRWAGDVLVASGSPRDDADLLLCSLLGCRRHELVLDGNSEMTPGLAGEFHTMVLLRRNRTPLQHITGFADFMGRRFLCGPEAMVPRPETEVLVEVAAGLMPGDPDMVLDVGTGSGVVAITLALMMPSATVIGTDISAGSLGLAAGNRDLHGTSNVLLVLSDLLECFRCQAGVVSAVVANLPYVESGAMASLQPEVRLGDPPCSLDGGDDGLELVRRLIPDAAGILRPGGLLALEVGCGQAGAVAGILEGSGGDWRGIGCHDDLSGIGRVVTAFLGKGAAK